MSTNYDLYSLQQIVERLCTLQVLSNHRNEAFDLNKGISMLNNLVYGIPIGAIILWGTTRKPQTNARVFTSVEPRAEGPSRSGALEYIILDGLQRLKALYSLKCGGIPLPDKVIPVYYNIMSREFVLGEDRRDQPELIPASLLLDSLGVMRFIRKNNLADQDILILDSVRGALNNAKVNVISVLSDNIEMMDRAYTYLQNHPLGTCYKSW